MHEKRFCLNCLNTQEMTVHGRCSCCDSEAVVLPESIHGLIGNLSESIAECEHIYALKGK